MLKSLGALIGGTALALALNSPAHAVLQINANVNGVLFSCVDGAACDLDTNPGILNVGSQSLGGVEIFGTFQTQRIASGPGTINRLDTTSFNIENTNNVAVPITVAVSGTSFTGPVQSFTTSSTSNFSEAIGSTFLLNDYGDVTNTQGADTPTDHPGALLDTFSGTVTDQSQSFSHNNAGAFVDNDLFSLTLFADAVLAANGTLTNRTQSIILEQTTAIPEPNTLALIGSGLFAMGWVLRRNRKNRDNPGMISA